MMRAFYFLLARLSYPLIKLKQSYGRVVNISGTGGYCISRFQNGPSYLSQTQG